MELRLDFLARYLEDPAFQRAFRRNDLLRDAKKFCDQWGLAFDDDQVQVALRTCRKFGPKDERITIETLKGFFVSASFVPYSRRCIEISWRPFEEQPEAAVARFLKRLPQQVLRALDSIADDYKGFKKFPRQASPKLAMQLGWLYQHQRHGSSYEDIYQEIKKTASIENRRAIEIACQRLSEKMGLIRLDFRTAKLKSSEQTRR